jgi:hypothetical protein
MKRLFLEDFTDQHLLWLKNALDCSVGITVEECFRDIIDGKLMIYEVGGGIIGLRQEPKQIFVELVAGKDMKPYAKEIVKAVRHAAGGQPVEGFVTHPALARFYRRLGFKPVGTYMRLDEDGHEST